MNAVEKYKGTQTIYYTKDLSFQIYSLFSIRNF